MTSTPSYGMVGLKSGNTGIGTGMTGQAGMPRMNSDFTGLSMAGMNSSGMTGASSLHSGSFGMSSANSTSRFSATVSSGGSQAKTTNGSTALDSLFAPELEHLQSKNKPSMNAMQTHQGAVNPGKSSLGLAKGGVGRLRAVPVSLSPIKRRILDRKQTREFKNARFSRVHFSFVYLCIVWLSYRSRLSENEFRLPVQRAGWKGCIFGLVPVLMED